MASPCFSVGDLVRVREGVADHDHPDLSIAGWSAIVVDAFTIQEDLAVQHYDLVWTEKTLTQAHPIYRELAEIEGLDHQRYAITEEELELDPGTPLCLTPPLKEVLAKYEEQKRLRNQFDFFATGSHEDEETAELYEEKLYRKFIESPEFKALEENSEGLLYILPVFAEYARVYFGDTIAEITPYVQSRVLLSTFPRKMMIAADEAPFIVEELRAFWSFVERAFRHAPAAACREQLNDDFTQDLKHELGDSDNFSMAKSFMSQGHEAGFDVAMKEGPARWTELSNQLENLSILGAPEPALPQSSKPTFTPKEKKARKKKRQAQRKQRKRSRKKKR